MILDRALALTFAAVYFANDLSIAPDGRRVYLIASSRPEIPDTALDDQEVVAYSLIDGSTAWKLSALAGYPFWKVRFVCNWSVG